MPSRTAVIAPKQSLPVRGAWIEMTFALGAKRRWKKSLPVRGAWIEIFSGNREGLKAFVAPRAGSVD